MRAGMFVRSAMAPSPGIRTGSCRRSDPCGGARAASTQVFDRPGAASTKAETAPDCLDRHWPKTGRSIRMVGGPREALPLGQE
jgi:hypothetical protein